MENHHSSAVARNAAMGRSGSPEKDVAMPNLSSAADVAATVPASNDDDVSKGKSVAADNEELNRMRDYYGELQALIPEIPDKSDKATIMGHTIQYIKSLQKTQATLEKRNKDQRALARQGAVVEAAASSSSATPQTAAQGMALAAAMSSDACSYAPPLQPAVPVPAPELQLPATMSPDDAPEPPPLAPVEPAPPQVPIITARRVGFQTWTWPNLVLSVRNDAAYISVSAPGYHGMWTMVMVLSVLNQYGIDVVTAVMDSDATRSVFNIYTRVTAMDGGNSSALEVYQLAVSEILVWLTTS